MPPPAPLRRDVIVATAARLLAALVLIDPSSAAEEQIQAVRLDDCIELALTGNRDLQFERIAPKIALLQRDVAYGYYDPVFSAQTRRENASDTGGFDPVDFSRDAVYSAESVVSQSTITGVLPTGLSYSLDTSYATSTGERNGLNFDSHRITLGGTVRQPLLKNLWIDAGRLVLRASRHQIQWSRHGLEIVASRVVGEVEAAYIGLQAAHEQLRVLQGIQTAWEGWAQGMGKQIAQGLATSSDLALARARLARGETSVIEASNQVWIASLQLAGVMGEGFRNRAVEVMRPLDPLLTMPITVDLQQSWARGLEFRQENLQLREQQAIAQLQTRFRKNQLLPSLDVTAGYSRKGASADQLPPPLAPEADVGAAWGQVSSSAAPTDWIGAVFTMPLSRKADRAQYRISREVEAQTRIRLEQQEEAVLREIADAAHAVESGYRRVRSARVAMEAIEETLAGETRRMEGGRGTWFLVFTIQADVLAARMVEIRTRAEYNLAVSRLRYAEGTLLQARGLTLQLPSRTRPPP